MVPKFPCHSILKLFPVIFTFALNPEDQDLRNLFPYQASEHGIQNSFRALWENYISIYFFNCDLLEIFYSGHPACDYH